MADLFQIKQGDSIPTLELDAGREDNSQQTLAWTDSPSKSTTATLPDLTTTDTLDFIFWPQQSPASQTTIAAVAIAPAAHNVDVKFTAAVSALLAPGMYSGKLVGTTGIEVETFPACELMTFQVCA